MQDPESGDSPLHGRAPIVTTTDTQGRITYANSAFLRRSGFDIGDVLGAPHNVVRHPDMPARVFGDLWASLQAGQPWTGLIKNSRRDGGSYWVKANVIPVRRGGTPTGYTSVQLAPQSHEVDKAESVYRLWREGGGLQHGLRQGRIVDTGLAAWLSALRNPLDLPVQRRVQGSAGLLALLFAGVVGCALAPSAFVSLTQGLGGWRPWAIATGILGMVASAAIALYFQGRIVAPLRQSWETATAIAGGDLGRTFDDSPASGELRDLNRALDQLVAKMAAVLRDAHEHSVQVGTSVGGLALGAQRLAERSAEQSADVGQVAGLTARIDELSARTTASAHEADRAARLATDEAADARTIARTLQDSMRDIAAFGKRIADISGRIDEISVQTGILALNAAAAASRDAELGRTFTVVASEVRALARRSGEAAQEIRALSDESRQKTEVGLALAGRMGDKAESAALRIGALGAMVTRISEAAQAQSDGVQQIDERLHALDVSTQQNVALARESVAASDAAARDTAQLQAALGVWHL